MVMTLAKKALALSASLAPIAAALALAACSDSRAGRSVAPVAGEAGRPIPLLQTRPPAIGASVRMATPQGLERAIERYRINAKLPAASYRSAGVDLDGDGRAEALVLAEGEGWCVKTGCTLLVLRKAARGLSPISVIKRVKPPVVVAHTSRLGWRDLYVRTGGGGIRLQTVKLSFSANGYPKNASVLPPYLGAAEANGETIFAAAEGNGRTATAAGAELAPR